MADQTSTSDQGVQERASELAGSAKAQTQGVVEDVRHEASAVASEAGTQVQNLLEEAVSTVRHQADDGAGRAAEAVGGMGRRLQALADGDVEQAGDLGRYAADLGQRLTSAADRFNERGVDGLVKDVQSFGRRRPGLFLAAAAVTGFAAGRLVRGARAEASSTNGDRSSATAGRTAVGQSAPSLGGAPTGIGPGPTPAGGSAAEHTGGSTSTRGSTPGSTAPYPGDHYPGQTPVPPAPMPPPGTLPAEPYPGEPGRGPR